MYAARETCERDLDEHAAAATCTGGLKDGSADEAARLVAAEAALLLHMSTCASTEPAIAACENHAAQRFVHEHASKKEHCSQPAVSRQSCLRPVACQCSRRRYNRDWQQAYVFFLFLTWHNQVLLYARSCGKGIAAAGSRV